jgi:hypothetical protein
LANTPSKRSGRQIEWRKVLLPNVAAAVRPSHFGEACGPVETDCDVTQRRERLEIASGAAAKVEDRERRRAFDVRQQRGNVLAHVVVPRALPEIVRARVVMRERALRDSLQVFALPIVVLRHRLA